MEDDQPTREEIAERYGWAEGEREQAEREIAARAERSKRDETLAWCAQRAAPGSSTAGPTDELGRPLNDPRYRLDPEVITKGYGAPVTQHRAATAAPASMTKEWQDYIERRIRKGRNAAAEEMAVAIAQTLGKSLVAVEREVAELHKRQVDLDNEINEMIRRQRASAQFDELNERLKQLEATPAVKCDATPRDFDRGAFDGWQH